MRSTIRAGRKSSRQRKRENAAVNLQIFFQLFSLFCLILCLLLLLFPLQRGEVRFLPKATPHVENVTMPSVPETTLMSETMAVSKKEEVRLLFTGDVLIHLPILNEGLTHTENGQEADFSWLFRYTRDLLQSADLAVGNMEGTLTEPPYAGYPVFRAPAVLAENLKEAGFDLMSTVNNHCLDGGMEGFQSTVRHLREAGLEVVGSRLSAEEPLFYLTEIKGVKIAISSFAYESGRLGERLELRTFNDNILPAEANDLLDSFTTLNIPELRAADELKLRERVRAMKASGADFVIFLMHWGVEYAGTTDPIQEAYASVLAEEGVDLVVGSHPHVVQPLTRLPARNSRGEMIVYYSLGNFVSNQQADTGNSAGRAEEGAIARIVLERSEDGTVGLKEAGYEELYMVKSYPNYPLENRTYGWALPLREALQDPNRFEADGIIDRLLQARDSTRRVMGQEIFYD